MILSRYLAVVSVFVVGMFGQSHQIAAVTNAANGERVTTVSPRMLLTIYGTFGVNEASGADTNKTLPTKLGGVTVTFETAEKIFLGRLTFVSAGQINLVVPEVEIPASHNGLVEMVVDDGSPIYGNVVPLYVGEAQPALFGFAHMASSPT